MYGVCQRGDGNLFEMQSMILVLFDMFEKSCVMAVIAYCLLQTRFFGSLLAKKLKLRQQLVAGLVFTVISVYGTINALLWNGIWVALSHSGQIIAGLFSGPLMGSGIGGIIAVYLLIVSHGEMILPAIHALLAGIVAGLYQLWRKGSDITVMDGVLFTLVFEVVARSIQFMGTTDFMIAFKVQGTIILLLALGHIMMVGSFILVVNKLVEERKNRTFRERLDSELTMARNIQLSLVPNVFPPFPEREEFDIYAILQPAKEVGGDIYDFFFLGEQRLCFMIGDVSGKGMPAALFMSGTRTLFKAEADREDDTAEILRRVNNELCRGNDASMFVTLFCGILDLKTSEIVFTNAGHNPPYLYRKEGELEAIVCKHGPAVGIIEGNCYGSGTIRLQPGDTIVMYTDGVTEAMNGENMMFDVQRLENVICNHTNHEPQDLLLAVMEAVEQFVDGAEQSDDITMMALTYTQKKAL